MDVTLFNVSVTLLLVSCSTGEAPITREFPDTGHIPDPYGCGIEFCVLPEECDGRDNDQDGLIDESDLGAPLSRYCTLAGLCPEGVQICAGGAWGPCTPNAAYAPEVGLLACNGLDDDCDGLIDEEPFIGGDVLFAVDRSGSMGRHLSAVSTSLDTFTSTLGTEWRFAMVVFPVTNRPDWAVWADFGTYGDIQSAFVRLATDRTMGGAEASYDVLRSAGQGSLGLSWRPGAARFIFLLTDEQGQSYSDPRIDETQACDAFRRGELVVSYSNHPANFDACGPAYALLELSSIGAEIANPCVP